MLQRRKGTIPNALGSGFWCHQDSIWYWSDILGRQYDPMWYCGGDNALWGAGVAPPICPTLQQFDLFCGKSKIYMHPHSGYTGDVIQNLICADKRTYSSIYKNSVWINQAICGLCISRGTSTEPQTTTYFVCHHYHQHICLLWLWLLELLRRDDTFLWT